MWCDDRFVINCWAFSCLSLAECPNITMEPLGRMNYCSNNGETVLMHPGPLAFSCVYELQSTTTNYKWFLDDNDTTFTTSSVNISIPSGSHNVTVTTFINVTDYLRTLGLPDQYSEECSSCNDTRTIAVTVVGKYQQMFVISLVYLVWIPLYGMPNPALIIRFHWVIMYLFSNFVCINYCCNEAVYSPHRQKTHKSTIQKKLQYDETIQCNILQYSRVKKIQC